MPYEPFQYMYALDCLTSHIEQSYASYEDSVLDDGLDVTARLPKQFQHRFLLGPGRVSERKELEGNIGSFLEACVAFNHSIALCEITKSDPTLKRFGNVYRLVLRLGSTPTIILSSM